MKKFMSILITGLFLFMGGNLIAEDSSPPMDYGSNIDAVDVMNYADATYELSLATVSQSHAEVTTMVNLSLIQVPKIRGSNTWYANVGYDQELPINTYTEGTMINEKTFLLGSLNQFNRGRVWHSNVGFNS